MHAHRAPALAATGALALERFPVDESASQRSVEVARAVAAVRSVVVRHGAHLDGWRAHGGETMQAPDPSPPPEATVLAACGTSTVASVLPDGPDLGAVSGRGPRTGAPAGRRPTIAVEG